jgi:hypothetical protein
MKRILLLLSILIPMLSDAANTPPAFLNNPSSWLDNKPISWNQLHGKVVMLNVWTFG